MRSPATASASRHTNGTAMTPSPGSINNSSNSNNKSQNIAVTNPREPRYPFSLAVDSGPGPVPGPGDLGEGAALCVASHHFGGSLDVSWTTCDTRRRPPSRGPDAAWSPSLAIVFFFDFG